MDNITNIKDVNPNTLEYQEYQDSDNNLISSFDISNISFQPGIDNIEYHIFDSNKNIVFSEYNFNKYSLIDNSIVVDKKENLTFYGFEEGQFYTLYNFITPLFNSNQNSKFYISEISSDRTEIRLSSNTITNFKDSYNIFVSSSNNVSYFKDFYLNFGNNNLIIANNILLDEDTILIKLYEPLNVQFDIKSELWVVEKLSESIAYFFELITVLTETENIIQLQGPNLNIQVKDRISNSTGYVNYNSLNSSPSSSLTNQLNNILNKKSIRLNIDHANYANFIHFSSAETRLENFVYKLSLIENYNQLSLSSSFSSTNYYLTESKNIYQNKIKDVVENFDSYEYCLYFESSSISWPKLNSILPYINYSPTSSEGLSWLAGQLSSASLYDNENKDNLVNSIPSYLKYDPRNEPYELYVKMLGQHFDTLYLYTDELTNKYNSDNRVNVGMSKDLISDALKDFGIKIYQNNFATSDLYSSFLGIDPNLNLLPPTGSELITNYVTASSEVIPLEDINNEIYKRIYHNLPLLLKKKGTISGLRLLINTYGIPDTILRINEFGGKNRNESNDWDQFQNQFNFSFFTTSSGYVKYDIPGSNSLSGSLSTIEFRFKTTGIPLNNISQSLAHFAPDYNFNVVLEYSGSGYSSGSYSSSIVDPYNEYGTLKYIDDSNRSASLYLPFFNGDWWSVMVTINNTSPFTSSIYAKNKIYEGYDGNKIGFQASESLSSSYWVNISQSFYLSHPNNKILAGKTYLPFSGSFQELRFYKTLLNEDIFDDYVMNPHSIEGNQLEGDNSFNSLIFRAPLGSILDNNISSSRISIHPSINAFPVTYSFGTLNSSIYTFTGSYSFIPNREIYFYDQFPAGIKNIISNKIRLDNNILPDDKNTLSPIISIQQNYPISESYTRDVNYIEVGFSPQNEINEDIISQLGYFNIGNYIGDPRQLVNKNTTQYVDFNKLRNEYFKKYNRPFNLSDYIRLIKYFDNSLFKLIKDFTPARTSLATGVIIKQHLLERNRYSPAQVNYEENDYSGSIKSGPFNYSNSILYKTTGKDGGVFPNIDQTYSSSFIGLVGKSLINHNDNIEFLNGELNGAFIVASTQSLNSGNLFLHVDIPFINYILKFYYYGTSEVNYLNIITPSNGEILFNHNYVKISKNDFNGNANPNLRYLESFTVQFSDKSKNEYVILSRTEYSTYFMYNIIENQNGLISDGKILNYLTSASFSGSVTHSVGPSANEVQTIPLSTILYDNAGYLTASFNNFNDTFLMLGITSSFFNIKDYPNIFINFDLTCQFSTTSPNYTPYFALCKTSAPVENLTKFNASLPMGAVEIVKFSEGILNNLNQSLNVKASVEALLGESYFVVFKSSRSNSSVTASNFDFRIEQINAPNSGNSDLVIFNPFLSEKFEGENYDVLHGNVDSILDSQYYKRIDYLNYGIDPNYFQQILSGSAEPSSVKDYYYSLKRHIYPRYIGSRNTSDDFNTSSIYLSSILQDQLKISLGPSNQQGVAYKFDSTIFEFQGAKVPFPEISSNVFSKVYMSQILIADEKNSAIKIFNGENTFKFILQNQIYVNDELLFTPYESNNNSNYSNARVHNVIFSTPEMSKYMISGRSQASASIDFFQQKLYLNNSASLVLKDSNNFYTTGAFTTASIVINDISSSINNGDIWYVSLFDSLPNTVTGSILHKDFLLGSFPPLDNDGRAHALTLPGLGIYRILSTGFDTGYYLNLENFSIGFTAGTPALDTGLLLWKADTSGTSLLLVGSNFDNIGKGSFITKNASPFIKENQSYITQNFGNRPKN